MPLGYTNSLYVLAFDHRASFVKNVFGWEGEATVDQISQVSDYKQIIFDGFKQAVEQGVPKNDAAILTDEQFGTHVLEQAAAAGYTIMLGVEKSGQKEFAFDYGEHFGMHIEKFHPAIVKALVRYNPEDDKALNGRQLIRLKELSDYCHNHDVKFLIEPLIPATVAQLESVGSDQHAYDTQKRADLTVMMIHEMQAAGIEVDIWKIEGFETKDEYQKVANQAHSENRSDVGIVVLGRGAGMVEVDQWLNASKGVPGVIGFAIGRSIFHEPLMAFKKGEVSREETVSKIAEGYLHFYHTFIEKQ